MLELDERGYLCTARRVLHVFRYMSFAMNHLRKCFKMCIIKCVWWIYLCDLKNGPDSIYLVHSASTFLRIV